ncbi:MAG: PEGA domain-containing protein [Myxococcota bacterium]
MGPGLPARLGHALLLGTLLLAPALRAGTEPEPREEGTLLVVTVRPGAWVTVDGKPAGRTPLRVELAAGPHEVRVRRQGRPEVVVEVRVEPGRTSVVDGDSAVVRSARELAERLPGLSRAVLAVLLVPWAGVAASVAMLGLLGAAVLAPATPEIVPVAEVRTWVTPYWSTVQWLPIVVAVGAGLTAVVLLALPHLAHASARDAVD